MHDHFQQRTEEEKSLTLLGEACCSLLCQHHHHRVNGDKRFFEDTSCICVSHVDALEDQIRHREPWMNNKLTWCLNDSHFFPSVTHHRLIENLIHVGSTQCNLIPLFSLINFKLQRLVYPVNKLFSFFSTSGWFLAWLLSLNTLSGCRCRPYVCWSFLK